MAEARKLIQLSFIEENNAYKNKQKEIQRNQRMPPGMASQELMMYWGKTISPVPFCNHS